MAKKQTRKLQKRQNHTTQELLSDIKKVTPYVQNNLPIILKRLSLIFAFVTLLISNTALASSFAQLHFHITILSPLIFRPSAATIALALSITTLLANINRKNVVITSIVISSSSIFFLFSLMCLLSLLPQFQHIFYPLFINAFSVKDLNYVFTIAPNATTIFLLLSASLVFAQFTRTITLSQMLTIVSLLILLPIDISYIYGKNFIYSAQTSTKLAVPTTLALNALTLAISALQPRKGILSFLTQNTTAGMVGRRFIIVTILTPLILGWVVFFGFENGLYSEEFRFLLLISSSIVVFSICAYFIARSFEKNDLNRTRFQNNILFLSEASKVLGSSLSYAAVLRKLADLAVFYFADWASVEMLASKNTIKLLAVASTDPKKKNLVTAFRNMRITGATWQEKQGVPHVLKTGQPELYPHITQELLAQTARNKRELTLMQRLNIQSRMIIPLIVEKKTIGVLHFVSTNRNHLYTQYDLQIAQELAARASLAIENAQLYKNAQDAIKIRDEFISVASHELKTPLTSLKVYTEVLERKFNKKDKKTATYLQRMDGQISNITRLIQDLLDATRMQVGKLSFHFENFSFEDMVKSVLENFQPTVPHHNIIVEGHIKGHFYGDRQRLSQVFLNLLTNAAKYSPPAAKIEVTLRQTATHITLSVKDFGIGIAKKDVGKVFDRFYQVGGKKRANVGLGLGLYISKKIIEQHNGTIHVQSTKGKGSTFTISLPHPTAKLS